MTAATATKKAKKVPEDEVPLRPVARLPYRPSVPLSKIRKAVQVALARREEG